MGSDSTHWRTGTWGDVIDQMRRSLRHAPGRARRAEAAPLAAEGDELFAAAVTAAQAQEAVSQDAALQKGIELVVHELMQVGAGNDFGVGRRRSRRAAAPGGKACSVPGGSALWWTGASSGARWGCRADGLHARLSRS